MYTINIESGSIHTLHIVHIHTLYCAPTLCEIMSTRPTPSEWKSDTETLGKRIEILLSSQLKLENVFVSERHLAHAWW